MAYTSSIPNSGESLGSTRARINANFVEIDTYTKINHVGFNEGDAGKHIYLQLPEGTVSGKGVPATAANEGGLYTEVGTNPAEANLFFRGESNGKEYQLTRSDQTNNATFGNYTEYSVGPPSLNGGWTFLPGGLILQYGLVPNGQTSATVTFPIAFPTSVITVVFGLIRNNNTAHSVAIQSATLPTVTGFSYYSSSTNNAFYWHAIGN